ncbi:MAG: complex I NDUFA9 subunit family protein [Pseudomonadota bacterium]|nr:complex I NDUFA9 subunit family protein [Pseudomonadota bacterium]
MAREGVTVFGGTGFLGRTIVRQLVKAHARVRIAVRYPAAERADDVEQVQADVRDEAAVGAAIAGAQAAVNVVGLYVEQGEETFDAVHVQGALHVARQAKHHGLGRLIHISGIGAAPTSASPYIRARAQGELRVKKAFVGATIIRPSVLFGPQDAFLNALDWISRLLPVVPLFGTGQTRLQPVYVEDVAVAVAACLRDAASVGKTYELGGAEVRTYREILQQVLRHRGRRRALLPVPFVIWDMLASGLSILPAPPVTRDQIVLMRQDNVVHPGAESFEGLGVRPRSLSELLPFCLRQ